MIKNFLGVSKNIGDQLDKILWDALGSESYWFRNTVYILSIWE